MRIVKIIFGSFCAIITAAGIYNTALEPSMSNLLLTVAFAVLTWLLLIRKRGKKRRSAKASASKPARAREPKFVARETPVTERKTKFVAAETPAPVPKPMPVARETPAPAPKPMPIVAETVVPAPKPMPVAVETPVPVLKPMPVAVGTPAPAPKPMPVVVETVVPVPKPVPVAVETPAPVPKPMPVVTETPAPPPKAMSVSIAPVVPAPIAAPIVPAPVSVLEYTTPSVSQVKESTDILQYEGRIAGTNHGGRQNTIAALMKKEEEGEIIDYFLEESTYKGAPCIKVMADIFGVYKQPKHIGYIAAKDVDKVLPLIDTANVYVDLYGGPDAGYDFEEDRDFYYGASISLYSLAQSKQ